MLLLPKEQLISAEIKRVVCLNEFMRLFIFVFVVIVFSFSEWLSCLAVWGHSHRVRGGKKSIVVCVCVHVQNHER